MTLAPIRRNIQALPASRIREVTVAGHLARSTAPRRDPFLWKGPDTYDPLIVYQPRTWLLREGWKKAGAISKNETPSATRSIPRNA